jgi:molybdate transport system ATP-binding protein
LLELVLGARPAEHGRIAIGSEVLLDTERGFELPLEQRRLGYVPQDYALFPHLSVRDNVSFALGSARKVSSAKLRERVAAALSDLDLLALADRSVQGLSGGERQRVALARALVIEPRALLLDEPLSALDVHARREVRALLASHLQRLGLPTWVVTHDAEDARVLGQRIAVLEAGRIVQVGSYEELAGNPGSRFVAGLLGARE